MRSASRRRSTPVWDRTAARGSATSTTSTRRCRARSARTTWSRRGTKYGEQTQVYNGVDFTLNARFLEGGQFSGGVSVGRTTTDNCYQNSDPSLSAQGATAGTARNETFCSVTPTWGSGTQFKFLAVYPLPYDIQTSLIFQNVPGVNISASYNVPNAVVRESLGRNLAACPSQATLTCNSTYATQIIPSNSMYEPRLSQFDLRFSKVFGLGATRRLRGSLDILNVFNASAVLSMTTAYGSDGANWHERRPVAQRTLAQDRRELRLLIGQDRCRCTGSWIVSLARPGPLSQEGGPFFLCDS